MLTAPARHGNNRAVRGVIDFRAAACERGGQRHAGKILLDRDDGLTYPVRALGGPFLRPRAAGHAKAKSGDQTGGDDEAYSYYDRSRRVCAGACYCNGHPYQSRGGGCQDRLEQSVERAIYRHPTGGCLISLDGFDENNRPTNQTRTYSNLFNAEAVFTFDGYGRGTADFPTVTNIIVPGPNAPPVAQPGVSLSTGSGNFTYSVGPKNTVTVTLTDPVFKTLPALQSSTVIDRVVLEGHFGPNGVTLVKSDGAIEILTPSAGSPFPRICERSVILLSDHSRF